MFEYFRELYFLTWIRLLRISKWIINTVTWFRSIAFLNEFFPAYLPSLILSESRSFSDLRTLDRLSVTLSLFVKTKKTVIVNKAINKHQIYTFNHFNKVINSFVIILNNTFYWKKWCLLCLTNKNKVTPLLDRIAEWVKSPKIGERRSKK